MPLLKRKPVLLTPLPSLSAVLQPIPNIVPPPNVDPLLNPHHYPNLSPEELQAFVPPDSKNDDEQLAKLLSVFNGEFAKDQAMAITGKRRGGVQWPQKLLQQPGQAPTADGSEAGDAAEGRSASTPLAGPSTHPLRQSHPADPELNGGPPPPPYSAEVVHNPNGEPPSKEDDVPLVAWRIHDRECWYIPETGEIFMDYESYCARKAFYAQPLFQCEVSSKSSMGYIEALQSEQKEIRQLHTRFPRPLKKAVLSTIQFQIEGKLDSLADKIFDRFHNRFFNDEKVFVDVDGDKYLARIVKTFPPRTLTSSPTPLDAHHYATDLSLSMEEVIERDDPMKYFYNVRLIQEGGEGGEEGAAGEEGGEGGEGVGPVAGAEAFEGSTMEVQADKISRDRINFSRAMLKRFIRDCVDRDSPIYSPWVVKPAVAARYGIITTMTDEIRAGHTAYKEAQLGKRKREREERLGLNQPVVEEEVVQEEEKPKTKKEKREEEKKAREEERQKAKEKKEEEKKAKEEEDEKKKKKALKYPTEDLLVEWNQERDSAQGRIEVRPPLIKTLPFTDQFERFLMSWTFLNVMGTPLGLSPFTLDEFERSLYHSDTPSPSLINEIHATLLNALIHDIATGHAPVKPLSACGRQPENDTDYWEGRKHATTETLAPVVEPLSQTWTGRELGGRDRKGWEGVLVGCLWERASLETLPHYLDNILHLTFEDKPAPTRPTWSTGPSNGAGGASGLVHAKPEKRYPTLHHSHKLDIIAFLIELVGQTEVVKEYMEESVAQLTEVRKDQVEVKREWKRVIAEREALDPKEKPKEEEEKPAVDADGDATMDAPAPSVPGSPMASLNGHPQTNGGSSVALAPSIADRDELEDSPAPTRAEDPDAGEMEVDEEGEEDELSEAESHVGQSAATRRRAMKEKAQEREAEEALRSERAAKEREESRVKKAESKHVAAEKKRLTEEAEVLSARLKELDYDFRARIWTLRSRPLGYDRFGNKVWWMDAVGSAPMIVDGKVQWGTGRLYLQGAEKGEEEYIRQAAGAVVEEEVTPEAVKEKRAREEGETRLAPGEWGYYDDPEQLQNFVSWLNPKGIRETHLIKALRAWRPEMTAGMVRRRVALGIDAGAEGESESNNKRTRPSRRAAGGEGGEEREAYLHWKNKRVRGE
ncbi:hypothetical protein IAT38_005539 [Cryptococcus sp. DSM 104549]